MKLSVNWLKEYVDLPDDLAELATRLTLAGVEVAGYEKFLPYEKVIAVKVLDVSKHPDADKLWVVKATDGDKIRTIVCGAPNVVVGMLAPLALPDAVLPNGLEIKKRAVRGIESEGMLCAEDELGLGTDHSGIIFLPEDTPLGEPLSELNGVSDLIMELELTPNRPDLYCVLGLAREIAGLYKIEFRDPFKNIKNLKPHGAGTKAISEVPENICPSYNLTTINNVKNEPSPMWLQNRLLAGALRPISFLVDISNYILLLTGQPMHIFDAAKISGQELGAMYGRGGDKILGLDEHEYVLAEGDIVIGSPDKKVECVAGIIGGENSAVSIITKNIIMETAIFDPVSIQKTSSRLMNKTDSSRAFARGLDPSLPDKAAALAASLVSEIAGGEMVGYSQALPPNFEEKKVTASVEYISSRLGRAVEADEAKNILEAFGFMVAVKKDDLVVTVPTYRLDVAYDYDLVEEVGRVIGYGALPLSPLRGELTVGHDSEIFALARDLSARLLACGYSEYLTYSFNSEKLSEVFEILHELKPKGYFKLVNPMNADQAHLRATVAQTLASQALKYQHYYDELHAFEIGKAWPIIQNSEFSIQNSESWSLGLVVQKGKIDSEEAAQELVGLIHQIFGSFGHLEISSQGNIILKNVKIGWVKNLGAGVAEYLKARRGTALAEINLEALMNQKNISTFQNVGELPAVVRDISLTGPDTSLAEVYRKFFDEIPYLNKYQLLDRYQLGGGQVVMTWRLAFQTDDKTLTAEEVEKSISELIEKMKVLGWQKK